MGLLYTFTKHINNESINKFIVLFFKFINKYILIDISILIIILLVSFFFFRLITQTISSWWRSLFVWDIYTYFSTLIINRYLSQKYLFFLKNPSSNLINHINLETRNFSSCINFFLIFCSEIIIFMFLLLLLLYHELVITLYLSLFILLGLFIYSLFFRSSLFDVGKNRIAIQNNLLQFLRDIFDGVKIIKINKVEKYFLHKVRKQIFSFAHIAQRQSFLNDVPRIIMDLIFMIFIVLLFISYYLNKDFVLEKSSSLILFIFAFVRIIPSINRIVTNYQNINFYKPTFLSLKKELSKTFFSKTVSEIKNIIFNKNIIIKNCSYRHLDQKKYFFNKLNLKINKYDCLGIYGESGAGKSTLIDLLSTLITLSKGHILIDGYSLKKPIDFLSWQSKIGYVSQSTFILRDSIKNNIAFGIQNHEIDEKRVLQAIKVASLEKLLNRFNNNINSLIDERGSNLSLGEQQRIGLARALYKNSELYIFDEPTSALDTRTGAEFIEFLARFRKDKTVIIISHNKDNLKICNKLIEIKLVVSNQGQLNRKILHIK